MNRFHRQPARGPRLAGALLFVSSFLLARAGWSAPAASAAAAPPSFAERHPDLKAPDPEQETDGGKARLQRAREHFALGAAALAAKDYKACEEHYAHAWTLQPSAGNASNLAQCENRLGYFVDAAEHLRDAQARLKPEDMDEAGLRRFEERTKAERAIALAQIAALDIQDAPEGAAISLGPKLRFVAPVQRVIFLYPGDYPLEVRTAQGVVYSARLHVVAGQSYVHSVRPKPRDEKGAPHDGDNGPNVPLVIVGGVASAALLGAGVGLVVTSHARLSDAATLRAEIGDIFGAQTGACHAPTGSLIPLCSKLDATTGDAAAFEGAGIAAVLLSGGVALATTTYALWPRASAPSSKPPPPSAAHWLGARVEVGAGGAGVTIEGLW